MLFSESSMDRVFIVEADYTCAYDLARTVDCHTCTMDNRACLAKLATGSSCNFSILTQCMVQVLSVFLCMHAYFVIQIAADLITGKIEHSNLIGTNLYLCSFLL